MKLTTDGGMEPYQHGQDTRSIASVVLDAELAKKAEKLTVSSQHDFVLLTEEELEEHFKKMEENNMKNKNENRKPVPDKVKRASVATVRR